MVFNAIAQRIEERSLNASKVGSHFSFYHCACVVTITVSPAKDIYKELLPSGKLGTAGGRWSGSREPLRAVQRRFDDGHGEENGTKVFPSPHGPLEWTRGVLKEALGGLPAYRPFWSARNSKNRGQEFRVVVFALDGF
jgi:hypothetical protein